MPARATMPLAAARTALLAARQRLAAADIPFFLCAGTLLGIIRNGDLLPYDKDMDIGVPWHIDRRRVLSALLADGVFQDANTQKHSDENRQWCISVTHTASPIALDVFFFRDDGDHFLCGFNHLPNPVLSRPRRFELSTWDWQGVSWLVPTPHENYLADMYGSDWRIPDTDFDTVISSGCQLPSSWAIRRCYGYARLSERLKTREWRKAAGYCRQMLKHGEDPYLEEVLKTIEQQTLPANRPDNLT